MGNSKAGRAWAHKLERREILKMLKKKKGNLKATAKALKMPYSTLNYNIRILNLLEQSQEIRKQAREKARKAVSASSESTEGPGVDYPTPEEELG